jgi:hypothetical protein
MHTRDEFLERTGRWCEGVVIYVTVREVDWRSGEHIATQGRVLCDPILSDFLSGRVIGAESGELLTDGEHGALSVVNGGFA